MRGIRPEILAYQPHVFVDPDPEGDKRKQPRRLFLPGQTCQQAGIRTECLLQHAAPSTSPSPSPAPDKPLPTQEPGLELKDVSLVFDCVSGEGIPAVLDLLDRYGVKRPSSSPKVITADRDTVRRILGSDHRPGILLDAGPPRAPGGRDTCRAGRKAQLRTGFIHLPENQVRSLRPPSARGNRSGTEIGTNRGMSMSILRSTPMITHRRHGIIATMNILKAAAASTGCP